MKNKILTLSSILIAALNFSSFAAAAEKNNCGGDIRFAKGASSTVLKGEVAGYEFCQYTFYAKAGQLLTVNMGENSRPLATIYSPVDHILADNQPYTLPKNGKYTLRIGMTRNDARKFPNQAQPFKAHFSISALPDKVTNTSSTANTPVVASTSRIEADDVKLSGDYQGILPCSDCRGVETYLALYDDGSYTFSEHYLGAQDERSKTEQGSWMRQGVVIVLQPEDGGEDSYWVEKAHDLYRVSQTQAGAAVPQIDPAYRIKRQSY